MYLTANKQTSEVQKSNLIYFMTSLGFARFSDQRVPLHDLECLYPV
jgi:hypothetical protein